ADCRAVAPAQPPELGAQGAEIELLPLGPADERGQLAAGGVVACSAGDREDPDLLLQPAPFGLERERPGVTVGQRPFQAGSVVDRLARVQKRGDLLEQRVLLRHGSPVFAGIRAPVWAASPIFDFSKS